MALPGDAPICVYRTHRWLLSVSRPCLVLHTRRSQNSLTAFSLFAGDNTNAFLNKNWREAFGAFKYLAEEAFGVLFRDLTNRVYRRFSYKELFPE